MENQKTNQPSGPNKEQIIIDGQDRTIVIKAKKEAEMHITHTLELLGLENTPKNRIVLLNEFLDFHKIGYHDGYGDGADGIEPRTYAQYF